MERKKEGSVVCGVRKEEEGFLDANGFWISQSSPPPPPKKRAKKNHFLFVIHQSEWPGWFLFFCRSCLRRRRRKES